MILKRLGFYQKPQKKTRHLLNQYFVDKYGRVWTMNQHTYFTKYGRFARTSKGLDRTVTMRDDNGKKVSISRSRLITAFHTNTTANF